MWYHKICATIMCTRPDENGFHQVATKTRRKGGGSSLPSHCPSKFLMELHTIQRQVAIK